MSDSISELATEALRAIESEPCGSREVRYIACVACPTVMDELINREQVRYLRIVPYLFEYDKSLKFCGGFRQFYSYKEPDIIHPTLINRFSFAIIVPPFDSDECILGTAVFTRRLLKNKNCKIILYTSAGKDDIAFRAFGAKKIDFVPDILKKTSQECTCYANYETSLV